MRRPREFVIALDQGSSSSRAAAFDEMLKPAGFAQFPVRTFRGPDGIVEHDALELARTQEKALDLVLSLLPARSNVIGLAIACQRSTVVFWDKTTGRPVGRALSWQDGRAAGIVAPLQGRKDELHQKTGLYPTPFYSAPKIQWTLERNPKVRQLADKGRLLAGPVASFLLWRLTNGDLFSCDPTLAQRMFLLDLDTLDWDPSLLKRFGVPRAVLPAIAPSSGQLAAIKRGGRRLEILACLGDQQAAAVAMGLDRPGRAVANYGTGAFLLYHAGFRPARVRGLLTSVAAAEPNRKAAFFLEGTMPAAGAGLDWLRQAGFFKDFAEIQKACESSEIRLWSTPAVGGLGAPYWEPSLPGGFFGVNALTRKADAVRSAVETIAYSLSDVANALAKSGRRLSGLTASGGLSGIDHLMQFQADLLQTPIRRLGHAQATASGAAALALRAMGRPAPQQSPRANGGRVFRPKLAPRRAAALRGFWEEFVATQRRLGRRLQPV